jgi:hypothetical protein
MKTTKGSNKMPKIFLDFTFAHALIPNDVIPPFSPFVFVYPSESLSYTNPQTHRPTNGNT